MPERPLSAVFAVNEISEKSVKDIFEDLQNIDIPTHGVRCLQRLLLYYLWQEGLTHLKLGSQKQSLVGNIEEHRLVRCSGATVDRHW